MRVLSRLYFFIVFFCIFLASSLTVFLIIFSSVTVNYYHLQIMATYWFRVPLQVSLLRRPRQTTRPLCHSQQNTLPRLVDPTHSHYTILCQSRLHYGRHGSCTHFN